MEQMPFLHMDDPLAVRLQQTLGVGFPFQVVWQQAPKSRMDPLDMEYAMVIPKQMTACMRFRTKTPMGGSSDGSARWRALHNSKWSNSGYAMLSNFHNSAWEQWRRKAQWDMWSDFSDS